MANRFTQNFTLTDLFNNKRLRNKIPLINYTEKEKEDGKMSIRTHLKTVGKQVFDTSAQAARPFYKPLKASKSGDTIIISGNLIGDLDGATEAVYNALLGKRQILSWTSNNGSLIRSALKESEKNKRNWGIEAKLYLRVQSMQQIEGMSQRQIEALLDDIVENIFYGDNFPQTQKKYDLDKLFTSSPYSYAERKEKWRQKVGI